MTSLLLYGANGYSGELIAHQAVRQGLKPILAGRNQQAITALAQQLNLEARGFPLDRPDDVDAGLKGVSAVLHCAGPFAHTYRAMADACLRQRVHYLDITGEIEVFEGLAARDAEAKAASVMLMPGVGFDVVPSDCLAVHLKQRLPSATHLALAIRALARTSRGTATTMVENLHHGGAVRRDGKIVPVPAAWLTRMIDFGSGLLPAITIPWGDVATAYHSTGIPNIEVYLATTLTVRLALRLTRYLRWAIGSWTGQWLLKKLARLGPPGPDEAQRAAGRIILWGEATDPAGQRVVSRLHCPEGYTCTALAAVAVAERVLKGELQPGYQTPARVYGADFVLGLPGVHRSAL